MDHIIALLETTLDSVRLAFIHNWIYLLISILIGSVLQLILDKDRIAAYLRKHQKGGVLAATVAAVATPLCSCGTTAVVIGMMASLMPWAPIVAFMVSSPLSSPEGMVYTAGLFGWSFAIAGFVASILLGLAGGAIAGVLERAGLLKGQTRFQESPVQGRLYAVAPAAGQACSCQAVVASKETPHSSSLMKKLASPEFISKALKDAGKLLVMFFSFAFLGYLINGLVPSAWIASLFGAGHAYSVPLAATLGLPFYINSEGSLPMIRAMLDSGMSQGAALAFLIAGSGTSAGAVAGALSIARWRIIAVVVGTLWAGAILVGIAYNLLLAAGLA